MGQVNAKQQQAEPEPQQEPQQPREYNRRPPRHASPRRTDSLVIQPQATFDSEFTLISPMSELSNPSQFLWKRQHQHVEPGHTIIHNVPPLPAELSNYRPQQQMEAVANEKKVVANQPILKPKKKKSKKKGIKKKAQRLKEALAGCAGATAGHAKTMGEVTTKTAVVCAKKTGGVIKDSGVVEKSGIAALNCAKASKAIASQSAHELARAVKKGYQQSKLANEDFQSNQLSDAARKSMVNLNDSDCVVVEYEDVPAGFQPEARRNLAYTSRGAKLEEEATPLAMLDRAFATAADGFHQEDDYFNRLTGPVAPSPFVAEQEVRERHRTSPLATSKAHPDSPVTITSLFSESSEDGRKTVGTKKISQYDAIAQSYKPAKETKGTKETKVKQRSIQSKSSEAEAKLQDKQAKPTKKYATRDELIKRAGVGKVRQDVYAPRETNNSSRDIFRTTTTAAAEKSERGRKKSYGSLKLTESAPSVLEAKDYRSIAWTTSEGAASAPSPVHRPHYTLCSPSASSVCSSSHGTPLVDKNVLSNAAFLFSPSYAGDNVELLQREKPMRDPAFSISTFASRARLSNVSSRSQPAITIPVSKSWEQEPEGDFDYDFYGAQSMDTGKHVRFSDANQLHHIEPSKGHQHVRNAAASQIRISREPKEPVFTLPQKIETPLIETKLSDLTEATFLNNAEEVSTTSGSMLSSLDARRISLQSDARRISLQSDTRRISLQSLLVGNRISPTNLIFGTTDNDLVSTASSERQGSTHWRYREGNGGVTATPMVGRSATSGDAMPAASPMLRFKAAKSKFANTTTTKDSPVKRTPPKKFAKHTPGKTIVSNRIFALNDKLKSTRQPVSKNPRRDTSGHRALAPHKANLVNSNVFRKPVSAPPREQEDVAVTNAIGIEDNEPILFDEDDDDDSSEAQSTLAELEDGPSGRLMAMTNDSSFISVATDVSEDPFADIIKSNYEIESEDEAPSRRRPASYGGNSIYSFATTSSYNRHSTGTYATDKEKSVPLTNLHKVSSKGKVNPADVYNHDNTRSLCLSPTQRTPMQARKWRTLAAAANEKDKTKKSSSKRGSRKGLSERSINVQ